MEPVVTALHLDNAVSARRRSSQTHRVHRAFSPAITEAHHLHWKSFADFFCKLPFHIMRHAEHRARAEFLLHRAHHGRMTMPCHEGSETKVEINVFITVDIVNVAALTIASKNRIGIVCPVVAGYAERQTLNRLLVRLARAWRPLFVCFDFLAKSLVHHFLHPYYRWPLTALRFASVVLRLFRIPTVHAPLPKTETALPEFGEKWFRWHHNLGRLHSCATNLASAEHHCCNRSRKAGVSRHGGKLRPHRMPSPHFHRRRGSPLSPPPCYHHPQRFDVLRRLRRRMLFQQGQKHRSRSYTRS